MGRLCVCPLCRGCGHGGLGVFMWPSCGWHRFFGLLASEYWIAAWPRSVRIVVPTGEHTCLWRGVPPSASVARSVVARVRGCLLALLLLCVSCRSCVLPLGPCPGCSWCLGMESASGSMSSAALPLAGCPVVPVSVCQCTTVGQQLQVSSPPVACPDSVPLTLCTSGGVSVSVSLWMSL